VHSQQRFHCMCVLGEATVDQAHRGYTAADDIQGKVTSPNPLFMRYAPGEDGSFAGQYTYGYRSFELFFRACVDVNAGTKPLRHFDQYLATVETTAVTTAILEAGRISLNTAGRPVAIVYGNPDPAAWFSPTGLELA
jgi:D-galacturonate reductase